MQVTIEIPPFSHHYIWLRILNTRTNPLQHTAHRRRSIHSPRQLYHDPPNINMEIGWHLSWVAQ